MYDHHSRTDPRAAFSTGDLDTASPAQVLVKCFDRLDLDLERGLAAIAIGDHETTNAELGHAQDLLDGMVGMLDVTAWEHAGALLSVYDYVLRLLAVAGMRKIDGPVIEARGLLRELGDGFRVAADHQQTGAEPVGSAAVAGAARTATAALAAGGDGPRSISVLA